MLLTCPGSKSFVRSVRFFCLSLESIELKKVAGVSMVVLLQRYLSQGVTYLRKYFCDELNAFWAVPGHVVV